MRRPEFGNYVAVATRTERARAFIPGPLPPAPPIEWTSELRDGFDRASLALGRLDALPRLLPEISLLIPLQIAKEAALSSTSDGEGAGLGEILFLNLDNGVNAENSGIYPVFRLYKALEWLWDELGRTGLVDSDFLKRFYARISGFSENYREGTSRLSVTQVGNASFIPPPPEFISSGMTDLDRFLRDSRRPASFLVKAALVQAQIEMLQPFETGNSRIARTVLTMILRESGTASEPILCPSFHFSLHRREYYEHLNKLRNLGEWEEWFTFFAWSVERSAEHSFESLRNMVELTRQDADSVIALGRPAESALKVFFAMVSQPVVTSNWLVARTGLTPATVNKSLVHLSDLGVAMEITSRRRDRVFCYRGLLEETCRETGLRPIRLD